MIESLIKNSFIYLFIRKLLSAAQNSYKYSKTSRIVNAAAESIMRLWRYSLLKKIMFEDLGIENKFQNGPTGRLLSVFSKERSSKSNIVMGSTMVSALKNIMDNLLYMSVRGYGLFLVAFGIPACVLQIIFVDGFYLIFMTAVFSIVLGIILILVNRSLTELFYGSRLCVFTAGLFDFDGTGQNPRVTCVRQDKGFYAFYIALGLIIGCISVLLSSEMFIIVAGGIIGFFLVMYKTEIGVFALAFFLPLVQTKLVLAVCGLTVLSFAVKVLIMKTKPLVINVGDLFVLIFAMMLLYSIFTSYNRADSLFMVSLYVLFTMMYFVVKNVITTRQKLFAVVITIAISGFLTAAYGVFQKLTGLYQATSSWIDSSMFSAETGRVYSTLDNPNVLGEYLIFIVILAFAFMYCYRQYMNRLLTFVVLAVTCLCMLYTQSRGAWLGLIFAFGIFALLKDRRLIGFGLLAVFIMPVVLPDSIINRFLSIGNVSDTSTSYRINIWLACLLMIRDYWISGIGLGTGTFTRVYDLYAFNAIYAPHSHNLYLQVIIDLGIFGLLAFFAIIFCFFKNLLLTVKGSQDSYLKVIAAAVAAGMAGYLLQGLTDNVWYNYRIVAFFWFMVALSGAIINICRSEQERDWTNAKNGNKESVK